MNRQEKRKKQRLESWINSLPKDKLMLIEQTISNRVEKQVWAINQAIDTSVAAALFDLQDLSTKEIEEVLKLSNEYLKDSEEFLRKNGEKWIMELKKIEPQIKARIKELREAGVLKSRGLVELKKEFDKVPAKDLSNFWLEVKEEEEEKEAKKKTKTKEVKKVASKKVEKKEEVKVEAKKKLEVLKVIVKGEYGTYVKEGNKVKANNLEFNNADDVAKYEKKLIAEEEELFLKRKAEIHSRLIEFVDVMLMEV